MRGGSTGNSSEAMRAHGHPTGLLTSVAVAVVISACSPAPSPNPSAASLATPSPTPPPTPIVTAPPAGVEWGEAVRLPGSEGRALSTTAVSFGGRVVVASTIMGDERAIAIWSSGDGLEWVRELPEALARSQATRLIAGPEGLLLAGATGVARVAAPGASIGRAAIWASSDGHTWTEVSTAAGFDGAWITDIARGGAAILAVGHETVSAADDEACPTAAIWRSADGAAWSKVDPPVDCLRPTSVAGHDGRFVVLGQLRDPAAPSGLLGAMKPAAWVLDLDGSWRRLEGLPPDGAAYTVVAGSSGFIMVAGSRTAADATPPWVVASDDGLAWTAAEAGAFDQRPDKRPALLPLGFADAFFVASVRTNADGRQETELFRSADGRAWDLMPASEALNRAPPLWTVVGHAGSVVAFGGRSGLISWMSPPAAGGPPPPVALEPEVVETTLPGSGAPRAVAYAGDEALAVGSEADPRIANVEGRVWRWSAGAGWESVVTTGLEGAELLGLAAGPSGWVAVGGIRRAGAGGATEYVAQAWTSQDGRSWAASALDREHLGISVSRLASVIAGGPGYLAIAQTMAPAKDCPGAGLTSVVLASADGVRWAAVADPDLACRQVNGLATAGDRLVAVGAESRIVSVPAPSPSPCGMDVCLVGTGFSESRALAWTSTDGRDWTPSADIGLGWGRTGPSSVAAGPGGFVAATGIDRLLWSPDGVTWEVTSMPIGQDAQSVELVAGGRDGYLARGTFRAAETSRFAFFFSAEGRTWQVISGSAWPIDRDVLPIAMSGRGEAHGFLVLGGRVGQPPTSWVVTP